MWGDPPGLGNISFKTASPEPLRKNVVALFSRQNKNGRLIVFNVTNLGKGCAPWRYLLGWEGCFAVS
jgi:hypothetical protein